jgi:hypothetical protein
MYKQIAVRGGGRLFPSTIRTKTSYFVALSDGVKRTYTFKDRLKGYNSIPIPSPKTLLIVNLYINGVLQPKIIYRIHKGRLKIRSMDIPPKGTPLVLQFIMLKTERVCKPRKTQKKKGRLAMAAPYLKLFLTATNTVGGSVDVTTTTNVAADVTRYSATVVLGMIGGGTTTVPATAFVDDNGDPVPAGGLVVPTDGYYNLYINGVLQHGGLSTLTVNNLVIQASIVLGVTVVLEVQDFAGTTSASTAVNNTTVSTTINT